MQKRVDLGVLRREAKAGAPKDEVRVTRGYLQLLARELGALRRQAQRSAAAQ